MLNLKNTFINTFNTNIKRSGSNELLSWLSSTDFFIAPASTKFHSSHDGGLCEHSLNVYTILKKRFLKNNADLETYTIISLMHDICKCNFYYKTFKNVKNLETDKWEKKSVYLINDKFPMGHGEKSVFLIERFMKLTEEEAMAIRWHMGAFDNNSSQYYNISNAFNQYSLCVKLHISDLEATYLNENQN